MTNSNYDYKSFFGEFSDSKIYSRTTWMITFADLLSLLLVFFILMYSVSSVKKDRLKGVIDSLDKEFGGKKIVKEHEAKPATNSGKLQLLRGADLDYLYTILESEIRDEAFLADKIELQNNGNNLSISIKSKNIFGGNTPILSDDSRMILFTIGEAIQKVNNRIEIVAYTDAENNKHLPKSWDLSMQRVVVIAGEMRKFGNLSKLETKVLMDKTSQKNGDFEIIIHEFVK